MADDETPKDENFNTIFTAHIKNILSQLCASLSEREARLVRRIVLLWKENKYFDPSLTESLLKISALVFVFIHSINFQKRENEDCEDEDQVKRFKNN